MKKVSWRAWSALVLSGVMVLGMAVLLVCTAVSGGDWAVFPGNPHTYTGGNLNSGVVTDVAGTVLLDSREGRVYASDAEVRASTLHLLGDREGFIDAPLLRTYADTLVGYDFLTGTYNLTGQTGTAVLSISAAAQTAAWRALAGRPGAVGVYPTRTGALLCAVTSPTSAPDHGPEIAGDLTGAYDGVYVNRFFQSAYTPGSIFKLVTAAAALETMPDAESRTYSCSGSCVIAGEVITCSGTHGTLDLSGALAHSCNVYFGQLAAELGADVLTEYADRLGAADALSLDGYRTAAGHFDLTDASDADVAWAGIGQYTDLVNPCAFLRLVGVIAGGGTAAEPYLMASVDGPKSDYTARMESTGRLLSEETCSKLQAMMRSNVETVYGAGNFPGLTVCAKSGTAETGDGMAPHATFAGFVADAAYPLAFVVMVEHGGAGSQTCVPIAAAVLAACVETMDAQAAG